MRDLSKVSVFRYIWIVGVEDNNKEVNLAFEL